MELEDDHGIFEFEDYFPSMVKQMGAGGFMAELCNGFRSLADSEKGVITLESLRRSSMKIGVGDEEVVVMMLKEGDLDGDGALSLLEFCILMFRLSPTLIHALAALHHHHETKSK